MSAPWKPSVTVAAVIERDGRFLTIEETTGDGLRLNQPAGHLDPDESLIDAVVRETMEETSHDFTPTALVGLYLARFVPHERPDLPENKDVTTDVDLAPSGRAADVTYLRVTFTGTVGCDHGLPLDNGIVRVLWMTYEELVDSRERHRSDLVLQCVEDYRCGQRAPLALLVTHASITEGDRG